MDCREIRDLLGLDRCISCGACTDACPSAHHGGIIPDKAVALVTDGVMPDKIRDCLMCHRCSMACPQEIDIAEMMTLLRSISGDIPERHLRNAVQVYRTGRTVTASKRTVSQRESLGLSSAGEADTDALRPVLDREGWPRE